jgi:hypothetical protein
MTSPKSKLPRSEAFLRFEQLARQIVSVPKKRSMLGKPSGTRRNNRPSPGRALKNSPEDR